MKKNKINFLNHINEQVKTITEEEELSWIMSLEGETKEEVKQNFYVFLEALKEHFVIKDVLVELNVLESRCNPDSYRFESERMGVVFVIELGKETFEYLILFDEYPNKEGEFSHFVKRGHNLAQCIRIVKMKEQLDRKKFECSLSYNQNDVTLLEKGFRWLVNRCKLYDVMTGFYTTETNSHIADYLADVVNEKKEYTNNLFFEKYNLQEKGFKEVLHITNQELLVINEKGFEMKVKKEEFLLAIEDFDKKKLEVSCR